MQPLIVVVADKPDSFGAYRDERDLYRRAASKVNTSRGGGENLSLRLV